MRKGRRPAKPGGEPEAASSGGPWRKLKVTAIVGALGAVVTLLTQANQVIDQVKALTARFSDDSATKAQRAREPTYDVNLKALSRVPFSLANLTSANEFLHWFWLAAENREPEALHVVVEVEVVDGPARRNVIKAGEYMIPAHGRIERAVHPAVEFINTDFRDDLPLRLIWRVRTTKQPLRELARDTITVPVLAKDVVPWGLHSARGNDIPRDFLVASLAAWVYTPERALEQRARAIADRVGAVPDVRLRLRRFMQQAYTDLFGANGVKVQPQARAFPPTSHEVIRTPARALADRRATALEAALLVAAHRAALGADIRGRLVLLALPVADREPDPKVFLLAWAIDGRDWEAIELNRAGDHPFEANHVAATARARAVIEERAELRSALEKPGVFVADDLRVVALRFNRARKHYSIRALP